MHTYKHAQNTKHKDSIKYSNNQKNINVHKHTIYKNRETEIKLKNIQIQKHTSKNRNKY